MSSSPAALDLSALAQRIAALEEKEEANSSKIKQLQECFLTVQNFNLALRYNNTKQAEIILDFLRGDIDLVDVDGSTSLSLATKSCPKLVPGILAKLGDARAKEALTKRDRDKRTPLYYAINNCPENLQIILDLLSSDEFYELIHMKFLLEVQSFTLHMEKVAVDLFYFVVDCRNNDVLRIVLNKLGDKAQEILKEKLYLDKYDHESSALHYAVRCNRTKWLEIMLDSLDYPSFDVIFNANKDITFSLCGRIKGSRFKDQFEQIVANYLAKKLLEGHKLSQYVFDYAVMLKKEIFKQVKKAGKTRAELDSLDELMRVFSGRKNVLNPKTPDTLTSFKKYLEELNDNSSQEAVGGAGSSAVRPAVEMSSILAGGAGASV